MTTLTKAPESLFWYWVTERHDIHVKKSAGLPKPWSLDPIFQQFKFTNPFRENDRGTMWLRENFLEPHKDDTKSALAFNICWYRMFNWWGTGKLLGWQTLWKPDYVKELLAIEQRNGRQVFTGAHIIHSEIGMPKIDSIVDVCSNLREVCYTERPWEIHDTLQGVFKSLLPVRHVGPFLAYEMVTDMRHTKILDQAPDIYTWANAGPGALRGLQRLGLPCANQTQACESMQSLLSRAPTSACMEAWPVPEMRDIEHSLCEFDKYCRVFYLEGNRPRSRYPGV